MLNFLKPSLAPLLLRFGLAAVFIFHGCLKLIVYGGAGWSEDVPTFAQHVVTWAELLCGGALLVGLLSRLAALVLAVLQVCAIASVAGHRDFIGLTSAKVAGVGLDFKQIGYEYNFVIIVACLAIIILGSGTLAIDQWIFHRKRALTMPMQPLGQPARAS